MISRSQPRRTWIRTSAVDLWMILVLIYVVPCVLGYIIYCVGACLIVRAIANRRGVRFSVWGSITGMLLGVAASFLCALLASRFTQGPMVYQEDSGKIVLVIGIALAPWLGSLVGWQQLLTSVLKLRVLRIGLAIVAVGIAIAIIEQMRPKTNFELVCLLDRRDRSMNSHYWREYAMRELLRRGDTAHDAIPGIIDVVERRYLTAPCYEEFQLLTYLGRDNDGSASMLGRVIEIAPDKIARTQAMDALTRMGKRATEAKETLRKVVQRRSSDDFAEGKLQRDAARLLLIVDPSEANQSVIQEYVAHQVERLANPDEQHSAMSRLKELWNASKSAIPALQKLAEETEDANFKAEITQAIRQISKTKPK